MQISVLLHLSVTENFRTEFHYSVSKYLNTGELKNICPEKSVTDVEIHLGYTLLCNSKLKICVVYLLSI